MGVQTTGLSGHLCCPPAMEYNVFWEQPYYPGLGRRRLKWPVEQPFDSTAGLFVCVCEPLLSAASVFIRVAPHNSHSCCGRVRANQWANTSEVHLDFSWSLSLPLIPHLLKHSVKTITTYKCMWVYSCKIRFRHTAQMLVLALLKRDWSVICYSQES